MPSQPWLARINTRVVLNARDPLQTNGCVWRVSVLLFSRPRSVQKRAVVLPPSARALKVRYETPPSVPHASMPDEPMWRASLTPVSCRHWQPFSFRAPPDALFFPMQPVFSADAFLLRRGELWRVRSQLPALSTGLRASLRGCDASLPERIHPPESTVISLPAHPRALVRSFQLLAFPSSCSDLIPAPVLHPALGRGRSPADQTPASSMAARHMLAVRAAAVRPTPRPKLSLPSSSLGSGS